MFTRNTTTAIFTASLVAGMTVWGCAESRHSAQPDGQNAAKAGGEEGDGEEVITLDKAPEAVRSAATRLAGGAGNITKVIKEEDEEDVVTFEVEYNEGATKCAAIFSTTGDLMESEKGTAESRLPASVMAALRKDYPGATFADPQSVTKMYYEVSVVINGKKHEVKVDASGNIEDKSKEGDEKGEGNEKDEGKENGEKHQGK